MSQYGLGWLGHIPDVRDQRYAARKFFTGKARPKIKELWYPPVKNQLNLGSCGPHAACTLMESVMVQNNMGEWRRRSPLALYYFYRETTGEVDIDSGVYNRTLLAVMAKFGVCAEDIWPYQMDRWKEKPIDDAYIDAEKHQILQYHLVDGLDEMLQCIAEGYAFLGGMPVFESFEYVGSDGHVPMPSPKEKMLGGHDLYFCGYSDYEKVIYGLNSWGPGWGKNGRFYLPYQYAETMLKGCYTITLQEG